MHHNHHYIKNVEEVGIVCVRRSNNILLMDSHQRIARVLQLITLLRARPAKAIRHLAKAINTSDRTIYRYLDTLRSLGFDIVQDDYMRF